MRPENGAVRLDAGLEQLTERLARLDTACVLATVIATTGSTYSKPGARMLIEAGGRITGLLSGGCLEQDLLVHASAVLACGGARTVTYDMRADNDVVFGIGAGCEGYLEILLEPAGPGTRAGRALSEASKGAREGMPVALVAIHEGPAERLGTHLCNPLEHERRADPLSEACARAVDGSRPREVRWIEPTGTHAAWIQPVLPLPAILICGAGPDAVPLTAALRALHYPVTVTDHRPAYARAESFTGAAVVLGTAATLAARLELSRFFAVVVMSHHLASDLDYLRALATTSLPYIGVLGPQSRRQRLLAELGSAAALIEARLRGPIGLDIGAVTPEGIALAITAEIHAVASSHNLHAFKRRLSLAAEPTATSAVHDGAAS